MVALLPELRPNGLYAALVSRQITRDANAINADRPADEVLAEDGHHSSGGRGGRHRDRVDGERGGDGVGRMRGELGYDTSDSHSKITLEWAPLLTFSSMSYMRTIALEFGVLTEYL